MRVLTWHHEKGLWLWKRETTFAAKNGTPFDLSSEISNGAQDLARGLNALIEQW
jgi:hypothetical protein